MAVPTAITVSSKSALLLPSFGAVPFDDEAWVKFLARKSDLESTMRPGGRPKRSLPAEKKLQD